MHKKIRFIVALGISRSSFRSSGDGIQASYAVGNWSPELLKGFPPTYQTFWASSLWTIQEPRT